MVATDKVVRAIGLTVLLATYQFNVQSRLFSSMARADTILIDDFNDGLDDGWSIGGSPLATPGIRDASSGTYLLESVSSVSGPASVASRWDASIDAQFANGFLRAKVLANNPESDIALVMRNSSSQTIAKNYSFLLSQAVTGPQLLILSFITPNPFVELAATPIDFASGEDWFLEAGSVGDELSFKAWRVGDPEPAAPQLTATDSTHSSGYFGLAAAVSPGRTGQAIGSFDDIYFTAVPEPTAWLMFALGSPAFAFFFSRRKRTQVI